MVSMTFATNGETKLLRIALGQCFFCKWLQTDRVNYNTMVDQGDSKKYFVVKGIFGPHNFETHIGFDM